MAVLRLKTEHIVIGGIGLAVILALSTFKTRLVNVLSAFIPSVEGFIPHPKWDYQQYSWGYGTAAPGSTGTITRAQAFADMLTYLLADYEKLKKRITRKLTVSEWAAYLSFSYNAGIGSAYNLVANINSGNDTALAAQWRKYIYVHVNGVPVVNDDLIERREKELNLWFS